MEDPVGAPEDACDNDPPTEPALHQDNRRRRVKLFGDLREDPEEERIHKDDRNECHDQLQRKREDLQDWSREEVKEEYECRNRR